MAAHKYAEMIKQWADGAEVQFRRAGSELWHDCMEPMWTDGFEYRIKPAEPERPLIETKMKIGDFQEALEDSGVAIPLHAAIMIANAALRHAADVGQIVTRAEFDRLAGSIDDLKRRAAYDGAIAMYNEVYMFGASKRAFCDIKIDYDAISARVK